MSPKPHAKPSRLKRMLRAGGTSLLTLTVVLGAGGAAVLGSQVLGERAAAAPTPEAAPAVPVRVTRLQPEGGYALTRAFVGQVEARAEADLSFELAGRVTKLMVDEGDAVAEGEIVARLDTALLEAESDRLRASRDAAQAQLDLAARRLERARSLRETGFASQDALDQAEAAEAELAARIAELDAGLASVGVSLEKSILRAPFSGRVGAVPADRGETLSPGQPVLSLIEDAAPRVRVGLPVGFDAAALEGAEVRLSTGRHAARLIQLRPDVDPLTRTQTAVFELEDGAVALAGDTATLSLQRFVETPGVWVPLDALSEAAGGGWSVLVAEQGIARIARVEVLHSDGVRAYVRGSFPDGAEMIAAGAHRLVPGQALVIHREEG